LAAPHAVVSSTSHGAINFPSKTKQRCVRLSTTEILSIALFPSSGGISNTRAKRTLLQVFEIWGWRERAGTYRCVETVEVNVNGRHHSLATRILIRFEAWAYVGRNTDEGKNLGF
jgi:hypothetical protein